MSTIGVSVTFKSGVLLGRKTIVFPSLWFLSVLDLCNLEALEGLVEVVGERIVLTRRGRLLGNEVSLRLTP
jgi:hypothetical protein